VKTKLQRRARQHGRSTEEEVREFLRNAVRDEARAPAKLGSRITARFSKLAWTRTSPNSAGSQFALRDSSNDPA